MEHVDFRSSLGSKVLSNFFWFFLGFLEFPLDLFFQRFLDFYLSFVQCYLCFVIIFQFPHFCHLLSLISLLCAISPRGILQFSTFRNRHRFFPVFFSCFLSFLAHRQNLKTGKKLSSFLPVFILQFFTSFLLIQAPQGLKTSLKTF